MVDPLPPVWAALGGDPAELDRLTVDEALEQGMEPREVWLAVCQAYDVPPARR